MQLLDVPGSLGNGKVVLKLISFPRFNYTIPHKLYALQPAYGSYYMAQ